jgi:hypothetical protein
MSGSRRSKKKDDQGVRHVYVIHLLFVSFSFQFQSNTVVFIYLIARPSPAPWVHGPWGPNLDSSGWLKSVAAHLASSTIINNPGKFLSRPSCVKHTYIHTNKQTNIHTYIHVYIESDAETKSTRRKEIDIESHSSWTLQVHLISVLTLHRPPSPPVPPSSLPLSFPPFTHG